MSRKIFIFAICRSSVCSIFSVGFALLIARFTYATAFMRRLKLLNLIHLMRACTSLVVAGNADGWTLSSSEAKMSGISLGQLSADSLSQAGPVNHSLCHKSSIVMNRVPISAGLFIPLTCFHCETSVVSKISATRFATNTCCLRCELFIH